MNTSFEQYAHRKTHSLLAKYKEATVFVASTPHGYDEFILFCDRKFVSWAKQDCSAYMLKLLPLVEEFASFWFCYETEDTGTEHMSFATAYNAFSFHGVFSTYKSVAEQAVDGLWSDFSHAISQGFDAKNELTLEFPPSYMNPDIGEHVDAVVERLEISIRTFKARRLILGNMKKRKEQRPVRETVIDVLGYGKALRYLNCGSLSELYKA